MFTRLKSSPLYHDMTPRLWFVSCFVSLGSMGFGFDNGWWGSALGLQPFAKKYGEYNPTMGEYVMPAKLTSAGTGTGSAGIILGCLVSPWSCEHLGRKKTLLVMSSFLVLGAVLEVTALTSFWQLVIGRILVYAGIGVASNVVPMYQSETAPTRVRGALLTLYSVWNTMGSFLSVLVVFLSQNIQSDWAYRIVILCQLFVPTGVILSYRYLPETPRWLVYKGRFEEAATSLRILNGPDYNTHEEVRLLQLQVEEQRELHAASSIWDCFKNTNLRRTIIATGVQILQQAQGVSFFNNFLVTFLIQLHFKDPLRANLWVTACGVTTNIVSLYTFDKVGRRICMFLGATGMAIMMLGVGGITFNGTDNISESAKAGATAMLVLWYSIFGLSWGPGVWILSGEIGTGQLREYTLLLASLGSFVTSVPINFANPYIQAQIGGRVALIYGSFSVAAMLFIFFVLPESKGRSLEELDEIFQARVSTFKFGSYQCSGLGAEISAIENHQKIYEEKNKAVDVHTEQVETV